MPASMEADIGLRTQKKSVLSDTPGDPFRIALLGDFSGHACGGSARRVTNPITVDSGNFDEVMESFGAGAQLNAGALSVDICFRSLDDFHPDALEERLPVFRAFSRIRAELADSVTFPAARRFLRARQWADSAAGAMPAGAHGRMTLESAAAKPTLHPDAAWEDFVRRSVAPHLAPETETSQAAWVAAVDAAAGALMRACLAQPAFRSVESVWRSVSFLLERLEARADLRIELIDAGKQELADLEPTGWSVAACLHRFAPEPQDCRLLAVLAALGRRAGGPELAEIDPRVAGCASMGDTPDPDDWRTPLDEAAETAWNWLRADPDAAWLGVALPRFLLRVPYGRETGEITSLPFEEMPLPPKHDSYLWGSPALALACLLGQAFLHHGWNMRPGQVRRLDRLPVHTYCCDGESRMMPPAEVWLSEYRAERILDLGAIPLVSARASDSLRVFHFQSVADPPAPLAGPWELDEI